MISTQKEHFQYSQKQKMPREPTNTCPASPTTRNAFEVLHEKHVIPKTRNTFARTTKFPKGSAPFAHTQPSFRNIMFSLLHTIAQNTHTSKHESHKQNTYI